MAMAQGLTIGEKYDVFLSFRGPDTRESFADCLFEFLNAEKLHVFMDDEELRVGESIGREIQKAIYDSKLFVPIFSKGYASSKWCLKEIAWMADCMEEFPGKMEMLPIFYDVDASDVKLKTDLYANALLDHEKTSGRETVERWRKALIKVPEVKGWNRRDARGQGQLSRLIAKDICQRLKLKHRKLPDPFIGIEEQVQHIMNALDYGSGDVRIVVIHGMGGIGKTTLASAVFNKICWQYHGCSFLPNVRESAAGNGILNLQNKLMRDILRFSSTNFCDVNDAMNRIQGLLRNKDVLVVLDDVSDKDQIKKLIGMGDWVGLGSRVIITTRNLSCVANVEDIENKVTILEGKKIFIYQMRELGFDNSLQLLCRHAFGRNVPPHGYEQLSHDILFFTKGIPSAIKVIGSDLKGKSMAFWKEMLKKLKMVPNDRLYQEILMLSYESLCEEEKQIFLDIAFFFAGHDKTNAFYYWKACNRFSEMSIDTLISYALVKIVFPDNFWMHNLLKDLGREVVRRESNGNLGRRSRLCNEDAKRLLLMGKGTEHVKALKLDSTHAHSFTPSQLSGLCDLQFLELCGGNFIGQFGDNCLSELVWLSWRDCPLDFRGTNFNLQNLVVLKLSDCKIMDTWAGWEQLRTATSLKVLELEGLNLIAIPDLASFSNLEIMIVKDCESLVQVDPSIGNLECLNSLEVTITSRIRYENCLKFLHMPSSICNLKALSRLEIEHSILKQLPENIGELKGLKVMRIAWCSFLQNLPDSIGDLESLCELHLIGDGITELPESIGKLRNLTKLDVSQNRLRRLPATIGDLDRLEVLAARGNSDLQGEIPWEFGKLRSLKSLDLSSTGICGLPPSMVQLSSLVSLDLESCDEIQEQPELLTRLTGLKISGMAMVEGFTIGEKYDVFLSFRGPDTCESFADCLFEVLKAEGLSVFMDDEELRVGESIGWKIQKAIYNSKLFVPILSRGFASSKWCLKEIAWMADCMEEFPGKKKMLPIFYDVHVRDVKPETDLYANALLDHEKTSDHETVEKWRKALIKATQVKGWNRRDTNGLGELIKQIAKDISRMLELKHRILPDHVIGIDDQVQDIIKKLDCGSGDVRILVIHGMGGIGKTTLASAVFNQMRGQFECHSFISDVRVNGIINLQNKLLEDMLRFPYRNFCDVNDAMNRIQGLLRNKDVLVVLDDVSDKDQIRKLIGMGDWVGLGSRVIITTRNLSFVANVEGIFIYEMREWGFDNSLQLLCWHAFGQNVPPHGYEQLSHDILSFTKRIPLAIEDIGSYLKGKDVEIWKEMLKKLTKVPNDAGQRRT